MEVILFNKRDLKVKVIRPESEWVPVPVPPLIDEDLFYQAQAQMAARDPKMGGKVDKTNTNLLKGKVVRGTNKYDGCRGGMTTTTGGSGGASLLCLSYLDQSGEDRMQGSLDEDGDSGHRTNGLQALPRFGIEDTKAVKSLRQRDGDQGAKSD